VNAPTVFRRLEPAQPSVVYDTYWRFATERQEIFFRRLRGTPPPWTTDAILATHKFTNVYRASDRVSQYLIRHVIYEGSQQADEILFRTILFKLFNSITTWRLLVRELGPPRWSTFTFENYDAVLTAALARGERIYSAAYIMPSGGWGFDRKHRNHLMLLDTMMRDRLAARIGRARHLRDVFELLRNYPTIGSFLAYQFAIDLNYSEIIDFSESSFVVPGPGALDGITKCFRKFGGLSEADLIKIVTERQHEEFAQRGLEFRSLFGRPLQLIDCQNLFCEISKYARLAHPDVKGVSDRTRIKQKYRPISDTLTLWYPPKWHINDHVAKG